MSINTWWMIGFFIFGSLATLICSNYNQVKLNNKVKELKDENIELKEIVVTISSTIETQARSIAIKALSGIIEEMQKTDTKEAK